MELKRLNYKYKYFECKWLIYFYTIYINFITNFVTIHSKYIITVEYSKKSMFIFIDCVMKTDLSDDYNKFIKYT